MAAPLLLAATIVAGAGCEKPKFTQAQKLGGKDITAAQLNRGYEAYMHFCYACHGEKGDGRGPAAPGLRPPPRNFTLGKFKFAAVPSGQLPYDEDLMRIVKGGLHGTAMLAWDIPDVVLVDILQYIKIFSERWKTEAPGEKIAASPDPFGAAKKAEAIALGSKIYHVLAQCPTCHPAYLTRKEMSDSSKEIRKGMDMTDFRADLYESVLKESDYKDAFFSGMIMPPDFTRNEVRSVRQGHELEDLYRVIASGVGGTAMPQWKNALEEPQLWAMAYYVKSLVELKSDAQGLSALRKKLADQPPPTPPPAE